MRHRLLLLLVSLLPIAGLLTACGHGSTSSPSVRGEVTVLAAASLTDAYKELGTAFESAHPGTKVTFGFGASSALATQVNQGAPADVFASADTATMDKVTAPGAAGTAGAPVPFATNRLQIIVGKGNPKGIASLADLARPGVVYVTAAAGVPIGAYAAQALAKAGVTVTPKSLEADVKAVVTKVALGEADAGIVYETDVIAAGDRAQGVTIPVAQNVVATYPIAVLKSARNLPGANAFVAFVTGAGGRAILAKYGFSAP